MRIRYFALPFAILTLAACQSPAGSTKSSTGEPAPMLEQTAPSAGTTGSTAPTFADWRGRLRVDALAAGVSATTFDRAFQNVTPDAEILAKNSAQPEYTRPIWAYLDSAVSQANVSAGQAALTANSQALAQTSDCPRS